MENIAIILNGASSAGKTLIATELMRLLNKQTVSTGFDDILSRAQANNKGFLKQLFRHFNPNYRINLFRQLHAEMNEHLGQNKTVVADTTIMEPIALKDLANQLADKKAYFIGVKPPLEISEKWEKERGDRPIGQARKHYDIVHRHGIYDLVIDTSKLTPAAAAYTILTHIKNQKPIAFAKLKQQNRGIA